MRDISHQLVVLGAGRPYRGERHSALIPTSGNRRVFDWVIEATRGLDPKICFVSGYRLQEVAREISGVTFAYNPDWEKCGSLSSLLCAPLGDDEDLFVSYSDIVFRRNVVELLQASKADVAVAIDPAWRRRYQDRTEEDLRDAEKVRFIGNKPEFGSNISLEQADAEFIGLFKIGRKAVNRLIAIREGRTDAPFDICAADMPKLLNWLIDEGLTWETIDASNHWAELNAPQDLARFLLGTKAQTLARLAPVLESATIGAQIAFEVGRWRSEPLAILDDINEAFGDRQVIVRSSALSEDNWESSNAGAFRSIPNLSANDPIALRQAVDDVIDSYQSENPINQVLVQEFLQEVTASGVAFTRTLSHGAPYYSINFDDSTDTTDAVTGGRGKNLRHLLIRRDRIEEFSGSAIAKRWPFLVRLIDALRELEALAQFDSLDVEFAATVDGEVNVLQVRPLLVKGSEWGESDSKVFETLENAGHDFQELCLARPASDGSIPIYGVMPDWNPAEIIGIKPRALSLSLYRYLITDEIWALQRSEFGYRDVRPQPLLVSFANHPYVDVRASFSSFIPASLSRDFSERLVDHYLNQLAARPELHDKVEFDIVFSCATFDFGSQSQRLIDSSMLESEVKELGAALVDINRTALERYASDLSAVEQLEARFPQYMESDLPPLEKAMALLDDAKWRGVLPFAHLARAAFIAIALLRSAVREGLFEDRDIDAYLASLGTVAKELSELAGKAARGEHEFDDLVGRFGHLRPGTYEIGVPKYADNVEIYLRPLCVESGHSALKTSTYEFSSEQRRRLERRLPDVGFPADADLFDRFVRTTIEGREYGKFVFTRNLSAALDLFAEYGESHGFDRDALSHVPLEALSMLRESAPRLPVEEVLRFHAEKGREIYQRAQAIELPPLIVDLSDFNFFLVPKLEPNFITSLHAEAPIYIVRSGMTEDDNLSGCIALISQADPGYDWLFSRGIVGLITAFGGANSHMAIRAAEFQVPAAIGVGEVEFDNLATAQVIQLDCGRRQIRVIG